MEPIERYRGCLLGLAVGDAVGTTLEFTTPGAFAPISDMVGGGPFHLNAGEWTDDTSMALCLAASLIECHGFDVADQMRRYVRWYRDGYMSSTGTCFDIGNTVRDALQRFGRTGDPFSDSTDPYSAGNGSLMRLAPVPLCYAHDARQAIARAGESSRTTHGALAAVDACRYYAGLIVGALNGVDKDTLLSTRYCPSVDSWSTQPLAPEVDAIAAGSFKTKQPPAIRGTGYVVQSLEAALWAFYRSDSFRAGCLRAVNLGEDADTTGAIYGQLAGVYYGAPDIPAEWRQRLAQRELIMQLAEQLLIESIHH